MLRDVASGTPAFDCLRAALSLDEVAWGGVRVECDALMVRAL